MRRVFSWYNTLSVGIFHKLLIRLLHVPYWYIWKVWENACLLVFDYHYLMLRYVQDQFVVPGLEHNYHIEVLAAR